MSSTLQSDQHIDNIDQVNVDCVHLDVGRSVRTMSQELTAAEAAARLGVKRETLYAYVSRGLLTRHREPGDRRSWFDPAEVDRLQSQSRRAGPRRQRLERPPTARLLKAHASSA